MDDSTPTNQEPPFEPDFGDRHCAHCGGKIERSARFCPNCGSPQGEPPASPIGTPSSPEPAPDGMISIAQIGPSGRVTVSKRALVIALVALAVVGLGTATIFTLLMDSDPRTETITGSITLFDDEEWRGQSLRTRCSGSGGYSDMRAGAPVTVRDENDVLIGSSSLTEGILETPGSCMFSFTIDGVRTAKFYAVTLVSGRRGTQTYSHDDLASMDWRLELTLGE